MGVYAALRAREVIVSPKVKAAIGLSVIILLGVGIFVASSLRLDAVAKSAQSQGFDVLEEDCTFEDAGVVCRAQPVMREHCTQRGESATSCVMKEEFKIVLTCCLWPVRHEHGDLTCQQTLDRCVWDF